MEESSKKPQRAEIYKLNKTTPIDFDSNEFDESIKKTGYDPSTIYIFTENSKPEMVAIDGKLYELKLPEVKV